MLQPIILSIARFCASLLIKCTKPGGSKYNPFVTIINKQIGKEFAGFRQQFAGFSDYY
jgi:hypothetical protein